MSQFGVYEIKGHSLVIDLQHDLFSDLRSRVIAPLRDPAEPSVTSSRLHPLVEVEERQYRVATHLMRAVERRELSRIVTLLDDEEFKIRSALDLLFSGF